MSMHDVSKAAFHRKLAEREAAVREGLAKFVGEAPAEQQPALEPQAAEQPAVVENVAERFPAPEQAAQPEPSPEQPAAEQPAPAADARENDPNYWRHRHLTTEGILKSERAKAKQLEEEAAALRAEADRLRKESLDKARKADAQLRERSLDQIDLTEFFTPAEIEEYGEKHLRTVLKGNVKAALKTIDPSLQAELEQMRAEMESLRGTAAHTREQAFWNQLDSAMPDWQSQQANPEFQEWLAEVDPVSGRTRDSYVKEAQKSLDAKRVVAIFKSFNGTTPKPASVASAPSRPSAPPAGKTTTAELPPPATKLRLADWQQFQREVQQGKWRGRDQQAAELDRKFQRALQEGNLV